MVHCLATTSSPQGQPGFLTAGERGYRAGMRKLFSSLIAQNVTGNVVVLDDDVLLRCDFHQRLKELLEKSRCGNHVALTSVAARSPAHP